MDSMNSKLDRSLAYLVEEERRTRRKCVVQVEEEETDEEDFVFDLFSDESPANIGFGFEQRAATGAAISPLGMSIGSGIVDLREDLAD